MASYHSGKSLVSTSVCCYFPINPPQSVSSVAQSCLTLCNPWTTACQASLSITNSWSLCKPMSIDSVMPFNHLILCCLLFLLPSIFSSIRVFSNESVLCIQWPKKKKIRVRVSGQSIEVSALASVLLMNIQD